MTTTTTVIRVLTNPLFVSPSSLPPFLPSSFLPVFVSSFDRESEERRRRQAEEREAFKEARRIEKLRARDELKNMRVEVRNSFGG